MKQRLFFTGPIGCGKSTAIEKALGEKFPVMGGFRTRRYRDKGLYFTLESPDSSHRETFLDLSGGEPVVNREVFSRLAVECIETGVPCVLDEIGGLELLCPEFMAALENLLERDVPVIGVLKGEGPAGALMDRLGLSEAYEAAAENLRRRLQQDENTLLYTCGQFDEKALVLAENWRKEYCP